MFTKHYTCTFIEIKINVPLYFVMLPNLAVKKVLTFFQATYSVSQNKEPPNVRFFSGKSGQVIPKYYRVFKSMVHWPPEEF